MLDSPLAPGPQLDANTKEPIDTTNINISSNINNSNNIINTTNSQTITLSIQQLQQILGLHGLSVVQPGQTNSSQIPQFITEPQLCNGLQNPLVTTLQSHSLNHVPTFPGINHNIPANQISTLNSSQLIPTPPTSFMPHNGKSNSHSGSMDISQGLDGVLTYKGVNYVRQDQAPAMQPIIIVMGGSSPQCLPKVPSVPQIQPVKGYCRPDDPAEEQFDDQRSAVDEQEDSVGSNVEDHLEDFGRDDQDGNCLSGPSIKDSGMILNLLNAQLSCPPLYFFRFDRLFGIIII